MIGDIARSLSQRAAGQLSAALALLGDRARNLPGILVYHRVTDRTPGAGEPTINVTPTQFRRQLAGLQARGYQFWPLQRLLSAAVKATPIDPRVVVVTFDDGYQCVATEAYPILRDLQIPATVFVNTAYLDGRAPFPFDRWSKAECKLLPAPAYRPLSWDECREMQDSGLIEIGAHTHTHADFRGKPAEFQEDLTTCVIELRSELDIADVSFAFPFGRRRHGFVDDHLLAAARRAGVTCALTTECELVDPRSDPFGWGRFNVYDWDTATTIAARLRGWYSWAPRCQDQIATWKRRALQKAGLL